MLSNFEKRRSMNESQPDFIRIQRQFTQYIRDPSQNPAPQDVASRRMRLYRELIYNNIERFLANNFPILRKITPDARWQAMVQDYFSRHRAHTPLFPKMAEEFLQYLENERDTRDDPPFILELAHYERMESALAIDTSAIDLAGIDPEGDLLAGIPILSPLAWPCVYHFPVHRIAPDFQPLEPGAQPTYLIVYRDRADRVGFMEANPVTARLLQWLLKDEGKTGREVLELIASEINHPLPEVVIRGGLEILCQLKQRDVILGVRTP
jgi:uncharacterized protein